ncbi:hypothetical protein BDV24DRAFT_161150 [Aspergillus arachidicola]|uniref:homoserine dehydrogenase n=1 Tax=Aspergillus arachidicola TaxID=656916 RepID=A0A5N6YF57_9EURO|nr:hypothetical protein BDV24DRAFT_161150 [Aspergillus arachidicola]
MATTLEEFGIAVIGEQRLHRTRPSPRLRLCYIAIIDYLSGAPSKVILVDNTSANSLAEAYPQFLRRGISIITPNKKALSGSYQLWEDIFSSADAGHSYVFHESFVGAGLPIISTLKDLIITGDEITRIQGVFSGTMSFRK